MGPIGIIRATRIALDQPIHRCPEIWITPKFIGRVPWWRFKFDFPDPLTDDSPWRLGLDAFVGHHVVYEVANVKSVWKIVDTDRRCRMLLCKWPD